MMTPTADAHLSAEDRRQDPESAHAQPSVYCHGQSARATIINAPDKKNNSTTSRIVPSPSTPSKDDLDEEERSNTNERKACCFICGSVALTALVTFVVCVIIPIVTIVIMIHRAQKVVTIASEFDTSFVPDGSDHSDSTSRFLRG